MEEADSSLSFVRGGFIDPKPMMHDWLFECHGFWHNALLITSSMLFMSYLASQARRSLSKLSHGGRSHIMVAYYASLWLFSLLNLAWCCLQGTMQVGWKLSLCTFLISGLVVGLDLLLKVTYLFGYGIPLFIKDSEHPRRIKGGIWVVHRLVLTAVYGCLLLVYNLRWRERLPGKSSGDAHIIPPLST
ncbi:hypothetical protein SAY86_006911 [Trapa natans]|uniref:Uncharacterized protein n=1 Tax=Trapa natans TaxID=22666 RepID=A0AAN7KZP9_TRANT|nr:hypothetical protein SAY86_006911 [Trapa natans]